MPSKGKRSRKKDTDRHRPARVHTGVHPSAFDDNRPLPEGSHYHTVPPPIVTSPHTGHNATTGTTSLCSASQEDHRTNYHPPSRSSSPGLRQDMPQNTSVMADFHKTQFAALQQGAFANSHDFTIDVVYMVDGGPTKEERYADEMRRVRQENRDEKERQEEEERQAAKALEKLAEKGMPSAMLNSRERLYAPRCSKNTRQTLHARIVNWAQSGEETRRLLWLSGPAAIGKSAVAQTVAEQLKEEGLLGAVFFFSRPSDRSDPDAVIPTLVYQLALLLPEYKTNVTRRLFKDPLILNEDYCSLFKHLIIDPFHVLTSQNQITLPQSLVIILDGLDECHNRKAQNDFVDIITHYLHSEPLSCLRWMICSRPEPNLQVAFSRAECNAVCREEKLEVDNDEARSDARRILDQGFAEIRERYPNQLAQRWPTEDQVSLIADRASGHLGFVSFIIRFIGDEVYEDPSGQLDACIGFLKRASGSTDLNPLYALDLLYTRILSDIPANILPTTRRILGLSIFYNNEHLTAAALVNFLELTQASFYRALQRLHSVLFVPAVTEAGTKSIQIYHTSFSDYLRDPARSGKFVLEEGVLPYLDVAISSLKWLRLGRKDSSEQVVPELTWNPATVPHETVLYSLCKFSFVPCWKACPQVPKDSLAQLLRALENFDFNLDYDKWKHETRDFAYFIRWLASLDTDSTLLVIVDRLTVLNGSLGQCHQTTVYHKDENPYIFTAPFLDVSTYTNHHEIFLQLGASGTVLCSLRVSSYLPPGFF